MQGFWWKLPVLRGLSPMARGAAEAFAVTFACGALLVFAIHRYASAPSRRLFELLAQVGATFLVAYAVETGWLLKVSHSRGAGRENWVGIASGLGACGLVGIALSLVLSEHGGKLSLIEEVGFGWSLISIGLLGVLVAVLPMFLYDWAHSVRTEYPDD